MLLVRISMECVFPMIEIPRSRDERYTDNGRCVVYCKACGKQIPDDSAFCNRCGAQQDDARGSPVRQQQREICTIRSTGVSGGFISSGGVKYDAVATGPHGSRVVDSTGKVPGGTDPKALSALNALYKRLTSSGWRMTGVDAQNYPVYER
jgi:hypothetical protein